MIEWFRWHWGHLWHTIWLICSRILLSILGLAVVAFCFSICPETTRALVLLCFQDFKRRVEDIAKATGYLLNVSVHYFHKHKDRCRHKTEPNFTLPEFKYEAVLNDRQFRLLKLHRKVPLQDLKCELVIKPLDKAEPYQAVSYTWSDQKPTEEVIINESRLLITPNAYKALRSMQSMWSTKMVWIDSICINQGNNSEKTAQIALMTDIYSKASQVTVWLGDSYDGHLAMQLTAELSITLLTVPALDLVKWYGNQLETPRWLALKKLVLRPWFSRVWVVQEVAVASSVQVRYGNLQLTWESLLPVFSAVVGPTTCLLALDPRTGVEASRNNQNAMVMEYFRNNRKQNTKISLFACLELCIGFSSKDPRDKIFALQAMSREGLGNLKPDYNKSAFEVYTDVARYILRTTDTNRLSMLSLAGTGFPRATIVDGLPSWVPQWNSRESGIPLTNTYNRKGPCVYDYNASSSTLPVIHWRQDPKLLVVGGVYIDEIVAIGNSPPLRLESDVTDPSSQTVSLDRLQNWTLEAQRLASKVPSPGLPCDHEQAFWRTCMGDRLMSAEGAVRPAPTEYGDYARDADKMRSCGYFISNPDDPRSFELMFSALREFSSVEEVQRCVSGSTKFEAAIGPHQYHRSFCTTRLGYIGLVPPYSQVGDTICVIFGTQTPSILRRVPGTIGNTYELIGECYIHGLMNGETVNSGMEMREFVLC
ncbi:heterokaryon incompatibility protein-domain-containing protein [Fusarium oxysporum Fo47]|uniref:heterokaryon incompatibility protein-domain-containing protein n=1 Tax=Fusarium oxysporum Fo47 TaxID=660027 RepID=UPI002869BCDB|nr:heterokaryon incompatibility protein-domain-containing protein [Fusarium oxysporum Fo47]QKD57102.2 heterokaryon incompatibility protein-domain-containing protein [Fusarium oxysporum Fo47]